MTNVSIGNVQQIPVHLGSRRTRKQYGIKYNAPLLFRRRDGLPLSLRAASVMSELSQQLVDYDEEVLEKCGTKISYLIHLQGQEKFTRQKYAHRRKGKQRYPHTLAKVAQQILEVVQEYIELTMLKNPTDDDTWRLGPGHIAFEDIVLLGLEQVTKATFRPVLGVLSRA